MLSVLTHALHIEFFRTNYTKVIHAWTCMRRPYLHIIIQAYRHKQATEQACHANNINNVHTYTCICLYLAYKSKFILICCLLLSPTFTPRFRWSILWHSPMYILSPTLRPNKCQALSIRVMGISVWECIPRFIPNSSKCVHIYKNFTRTPNTRFK